MSRVSVIIPCHNTAQYLAEAVQSVLDQTFSEFEVIIVDDGSTDGTPEIVRQFADPRVQYIRQENKGTASARNAGIAAAQGEYLTFLDADDTYLPEKLWSEVQLLDASREIGLVVNGWIFVDADGQALGDAIRPWQDYPTNPTLAYWLLGKPFVVHGVMLRRQWIGQSELFDETLSRGEDWDFFIRLVTKGVPIAWGREVVCTYRIHHQNVTLSPQRLHDTIRVLDKYYNATISHGLGKLIRSEAYANAWLQIANAYYMSGQTSDACACVRCALEWQPELLSQNAKGLQIRIRNWILDPRVVSSLQHLDLILANLPEEAKLNDAAQHRLWAQANMDIAYSSYNCGDYRRVVMTVLRALCHDPSWIQNRGLWAIIAKSLLG